MSERLTPVDILNLRFRRRAYGYGTGEVDDFVRRVSSDMEALLTEIAMLRERMASLERELGQYHEMESAIRDTLVMAQKAADDTRTLANKTAEDTCRLAQRAAEDIRNGARMQAEAELNQAHAHSREIEAAAQARLLEMNSHIERMRQERRRFVRDFRAQLTSHLEWLHEEFDRNETHSPAITRNRNRTPKFPRGEQAYPTMQPEEIEQTKEQGPAQDVAVAVVGDYSEAGHIAGGLTANDVPNRDVDLEEEYRRDEDGRDGHRQGKTVDGADLQQSADVAAHENG